MGVPYEYLDHQADLGIRGIGSSPEEAMSAAAQAMLDAMANTAKVDRKVRLVQRCTAPDIPALFVEWLNELLYQREVNDLMLATAQVVHLDASDEGWSLEGLAWGEPFDPERHETFVEVKAATYFGLDYWNEDGNYVIQCVVDL